MNITPRELQLLKVLRLNGLTTFQPENMASAKANYEDLKKRGYVIASEAIEGYMAVGLTDKGRAEISKHST